MSRTVYNIRKARKPHRCTERSYHKIKPGDLYLYGACPPEHEMNRTRPSDERRWEYIKACLRCAEEFGMNTNETREQCQREP